MVTPLTEVIRLLVESKHSEALALAKSRLVNMNSTFQTMQGTLHTLERDMTSLKEVIDGIESGNSSATDYQTSVRTSPAERSQRRYQILEAAKRLALESSNRTVTTDKVTSLLQQAGITAPNIRTVVGNILGKSEKWLTLGRALYRYIPVEVVDDGPPTDEVDDLPF